MFFCAGWTCWISGGGGDFSGGSGGRGGLGIVTGDSSGSGGRELAGWAPVVLYRLWYTHGALAIIAAVAGLSLGHLVGKCHLLGGCVYHFCSFTRLCPAGARF